MNRLLAIAGGQPLRSNDWDFIQDATEDTIKSIVKGLIGTTGTIIITGLQVVIGDGDISVSDGYLYKDDEIFYVPAATFTDHGELWSLYLTQNITTGESRTFKDTSTHNVYEYRQYAVGYASALPDGAIAFPGTNLLGLITSHVLSQVPAAPSQLLKLTTVTYSVASLATAQVLMAAPGAGKAIKVISLSCWLSPTTPLNVGAQDLNVAYYDDESSSILGTFPNSFIESTTAKLRDMTETPADMYVNQAVQAQLSAGAVPVSGSGTIKFHCYYVIITL